MQIKFKNEKENIEFKIEKEKITGLVCNDINYLNIINKMLYEQNSSSKSIDLISIKDIYGENNRKVNEYIKGENLDDMFNLLCINKKMLDKYMGELSTSEKILIMFAKVLSDNKDVIIIDDILSKLDSSLRSKIIKLLIKLKKFDKKTIVIASTNVDIIYEFIDNIIIFYNGLCLSSINKFDIYDNFSNIDKPLVIEIKNKVFDKSNIKLGNNDSINELMKAIYREIR